MNCKPDELARVVAPYAMNGRGAIVVTRRLLLPEQMVTVCGSTFRVHVPAWLCDGWVHNDHDEPLGPQCVISDHSLRPLPGLRVDAPEAVDIPFEEVTS